MGWKNLKEYYRITHTVRVTEAGVCIGSPYIHDLITVNADGSLTPCASGIDGDENLERYWAEMADDPQKVREVLASEDSFDQSLEVWTYDVGGIVQKYCETYGWPNCTHDGEMMYDNTFSHDRAQVVQWAIRNAELQCQYLVENIADLGDKVAEQKDQLATAEANLGALKKELKGD